MSDLVTFVFTDLVGSVDLKQRMPGAGAAERDQAYVQEVLTPHRERIERGLTEAKGRVVSTAGDGHFLAFRDTIQAARWAIAVQQSHAEEAICSSADPDAVVRVRIGLHVGVPQADPADAQNFIGRAVDYAARLADRATAGQILASRSAASLLEDAGLDGVELHSHGILSLRGIGEVEAHEIVYGGRKPAEPEQDEKSVDRRQWTVLPATMGLTEYSAQLAAAGAGSSGVEAPPAPGGKRVGNYELLDMIGAGGMGNVYRARHTMFGRTRAVKIIKPELVASGGQSVVHRFYQEIQATGSLEHPNLVVAIESSTPDDQEHFLVMEYIDGVGVDRLLTEEGALGVAEACEVARQAAIGLEHLHRQGLVHRDVKPSNVMLTCVNDHSSQGALTPTGSTSGFRKVALAKLMDLGLALLVRDDQQRLTRMDQGGMGTGHYMSPEQWRTTTVDIRADVYSLGCTLYHMLHGQPPYADSDLRPERAHEREPIPTLGEEVPPELDALLQRMMAKQPEDRLQRPIEVAQALAPFTSGHGLVEIVSRYTGRTAAAPRPYAETHTRRQAEVDTFVPARRDPGQPIERHRPERRRLLTGAVLIATACVAGLGWLAVSQRDQMLSRGRGELDRFAKLTAKLMSEQIDKRFTALQTLAEKPELRKWLREIDTTPGDESLWVGPQQWILHEKSQRDSNFRSSSWFLTDRRGVQVARASFSDSIGNSYAHRDYFHGQGGDLESSTTAIDPPPPVSEPHLSSVYVSTSTKQLKVAFSVPVWDKQSGSDRRVIGVLAMSVSLGQFKALSDADNEESPIETVMADTGFDYIIDNQPNRGLVLHHRLIKAGEEFSHPRLTEKMLREITTDRRVDGPSLLSDYDDLLGRGVRYEGAYAPIVIDNPGGRIETGWVILAQEPAR